MLLLILGTSSSGKTTLAKHLQGSLPDYWQRMSLDSFFSGVPSDYGGGANGLLSKRGFAYANKDTDAKIVCGELGHRLLRGMIDGALAIEAQGLNVLFDDMILDRVHADLWNRALPGVHSFAVRLEAPSHVLEQRNQDRSNPPRLALNHIKENEWVSADLIFNTAEREVGDCSGAIETELARRVIHRTR